MPHIALNSSNIPIKNKWYEYNFEVETEGRNTRMVILNNFKIPDGLKTKSNMDCTKVCFELFSPIGTCEKSYSSNKRCYTAEQTMQITGNPIPSHTLINNTLFHRYEFIYKDGKWDLMSNNTLNYITKSRNFTLQLKYWDPLIKAYVIPSFAKKINWEANLNFIV